MAALSRAYATDICRYPRALATDIRTNHQAVFRVFAVLILSLLMKYQPSKWKNTLFRCANKWDLLHAATPPYSLCNSIFDSNPFDLRA